jgi:multidrug efflux pump subunit AcrB
MLSAFNALSLSPALAAMLLKPKEKINRAGRSENFTTGSTASSKKRATVTSKSSAR